MIVPFHHGQFFGSDDLIEGCHDAGSGHDVSTGRLDDALTLTEASEVDYVIYRLFQ
jgi:hypothetical protein